MKDTREFVSYPTVEETIEVYDGGEPMAKKKQKVTKESELAKVESKAKPEKPATVKINRASKTKRKGDKVVKNELYFGDNLDVLKRYVKTESVDLIYLDPPFNSNADYNILFKERDGGKATAQIKVFGDMWVWGIESAAAFREVVDNGPRKVSDLMEAFREFLGGNNMLAYLSMMAPRLVELKRVLKPTGSIYLHCDPTASHFLKLLMDSVFDLQNFRSEIIWKRSTSHGNVSQNYGSLYDSILYYTLSTNFTWDQQYRPFTAEYIKEKFKKKDADGRRFQDVSLRNPGVRPNLHYSYTASNGVTYEPHPNGWACEVERLQKYDRESRLYFPKKVTGTLRLKMYLDESPGVKLQNIWDDIPAINSRAAERLGYPTQKPLTLLKRIIETSSNPGDVVLDPFCGCGTSIDAAQRLGRRWVGIDITHLATSLIKTRLQDSYGSKIIQSYSTLGEPTTLSGAEALALQDRFQFQYWALGLVGARPVQGDEKRGADKGIDGVQKFHDEGETSKAKRVLFSVKSGGVSVKDVRDLRGVINREKAAIGVLITLENPTQPMKVEAASGDFYTSPTVNSKHPRIQILTIADLLAGKRVDLPSIADFRTFKQAPKAKLAGTKNLEFAFDVDYDDNDGSDEDE